MSLPAFPRGCREVRLASKTSHASAPKDEDLFKKDKKKRKYKRHRNNNEDPEEFEAEFLEGQKVYFGPLMPELLSGGLLVLGCVDEIHEYDLTVNLPNGHSGIVSITDISQPYTRVLQEHADDQDSENPTSTVPAPLRALFSVGGYVMCRIKGDPDDVQLQFTNMSNPKKKLSSRTHLTLDPRVVNEGVTITSLYHEMLICAAVVSEEDHGYAMETGIGRTTAFLKHEHALKFQAAVNHGNPLMVGQLIWCSINMPDTDFANDHVGTIQLTADPAVVTKCQAGEEISWASLLPGTLLEGVVHGIDPLGLSVAIPENEAVVHCSHLDKSLETTSDYKFQQKVEGRLLYINPITNVLHLGLQGRIRRLYNLQPQFGGLGLWDFVAEATVARTTAHTVSLCLKKRFKGAANQIGVPPEHADDLKKYYPIGSTHRCRIIKFRRLDDFVSVTLHPELLDKQVVIYDAVQAGDLVEVAITQTQPRGLHVKILNSSELVYGFIPDVLVSDSADEDWRLTHKPGMELSCRVLHKKLDENFIFLAAKRSMLSDKGPPILSAFEEARPDMLVRGWVVKIFKDALLISFYNNVKGLVKMSEYRSGAMDKLEKQFACGQIVRCIVQSVDPQSNKLFLKMAPKKGESPKQNQEVMPVVPTSNGKNKKRPMEKDNIVDDLTVTKKAKKVNGKQRKGQQGQ